MKALIPSVILTLIVAAIVGSAGSSDSMLQLQNTRIAGHSFYWSWPFFVTVMAINCLLVLRMAESAKI
jgi:hypothetical protein